MLGDRPLGGVETAFALLAAAFVRRGHAVELRAGTAPAETRDGLRWAPLGQGGAPADLVIANRLPRLFRSLPAPQARRRRVLWLHNPGNYLRKPRQAVGDGEVGRRGRRAEWRPAQPVAGLGRRGPGAKFDLMPAPDEGRGEQGEGGLDATQRPVAQHARAEARALRRQDYAHPRASGTTRPRASGTTRISPAASAGAAPAPAWP